MENRLYSAWIESMLATSLLKQSWSNSPLSVPQVNMLIGIVVFNKLMSRDGISDKSKKQRAG